MTVVRLVLQDWHALHIEVEGPLGKPFELPDDLAARLSEATREFIAIQAEIKVFMVKHESAVRDEERRQQAARWNAQLKERRAEQEEQRRRIERRRQSQQGVNPWINGR